MVGSVRKTSTQTFVQGEKSNTFSSVPDQATRHSPNKATGLLAALAPRKTTSFAVKSGHLKTEKDVPKTNIHAHSEASSSSTQAASTGTKKTLNVSPRLKIAAFMRRRTKESPPGNETPSLPHHDHPMQTNNTSEQPNQPGIVPVLTGTDHEPPTFAAGKENNRPAHAQAPQGKSSTAKGFSMKPRLKLSALKQRNTSPRTPAQENQTSSASVAGNDISHTIEEMRRLSEDGAQQTLATAQHQQTLNLAASIANIQKSVASNIKNASGAG